MSLEPVIIIWELADYLKKFGNDPIGKDTETGKFYFWDETWRETVGPYDTAIEAFCALAKYCKQLEKEFKNEE